MVYRPNVEATLCFVLMPFREPHFEYFAGIIQPAAKEAGLTAIKADDIYGTAPIIQDIWNQVWAARAVIADVTGRNPNVNYELGICHALGVPTVLITQDLADVPFDYRHIRCILYDTKRVGWEDKLRHRITGTLKSVMAGTDVYEDLRWPYDTNAVPASGVISSLVSAEQGTDSVIKGARLVHDACATALGPHGTDISLSPTFGLARFDRSGVVIAGAITSTSALQRKGIEHAERLTIEMDAAVGDGSKTAVLIFQELVERGYKSFRDGAVLRDLIHQMDASIEEAVNKIKKLARPVTKKDIASVARTAASGDSNVGEIIQAVLLKSGPDGVISIVEGHDATTSITAREGMYFDRGFLSSRFITDETRQTIELSDVYVLIHDSKLTSMKELLPILEQVAKLGSPLLVIAESVEGEALETLAYNKERGTLSCVAVGAPRASDNRQFMLEDIAVSTGGTVISRASIRLDSIQISQLGKAKHVEVTRDSCWITGGMGDRQAIDTRAAGIRQQIEFRKSDYDVEILQERLANLVGTVCVVRVGGASSFDRDERMYKLRSALHSARGAVTSGVVPGGGATLFRVAEVLRQESNPVEIVSAALEAPLRRQIFNARGDEHDVVVEMEKSSILSVGFNAESCEVADLEKAAIVDPANVCTTAVQLAFVHARAILQTGAWDLTERPVSQNAGAAHRNPRGRQF